MCSLSGGLFVRKGVAMPGKGACKNLTSLRIRDPHIRREAWALASPHGSQSASTALHVSFPAQRLTGRSEAFLHGLRRWYSVELARLVRYRASRVNDRRADKLADCGTPTASAPAAPSNGESCYTIKSAEGYEDTMLLDSRSYP